MPERAFDLSKLEENGSVFSRPLFHEGRAYFGAEDSYFYCIDAETGRKIWDLKTGGIILSSPLLHESVIYFGSFDQYLYAITLEGEILWKARVSGRISSSPAIWDGMIFFGSSDTYLYAVSIKKRAVVWAYKTGDEIIGDPAIRGGKIFFGSMDGYFYCLDVFGKLLWKFRTGDSIIFGTPLVTDESVCFGSADNNLYCLTPEGEFKWALRTGDMVANNASIYEGAISEHPLGSDSRSAIKIAGNPALQKVLYFGSRDRYLYAVDAASGRVLWKALTEIHISFSRPLRIDDKIYVGSYRLYCFSDKGQKIWASEPSDIIISGPVLHNGNLYFGSNDSFLRCISREDGHIVWRFRPNNAKIVSLGGVVRPPAWNPDFFRERDTKFHDAASSQPKEPYGITKLPYGLGPVDVTSLGPDKKYAVSAESLNLYELANRPGEYGGPSASDKEYEKLRKQVKQQFGM